MWLKQEVEKNFQNDILKWYVLYSIAMK